MGAAGSALLNTNTHLFRLAKKKKRPKNRPPAKFKETQPLTLIFENESIAVPGRGLPIQVAGRKVVKISIFFI